MDDRTCSYKVNHLKAFQINNQQLLCQDLKLTMIYSQMHSTAPQNAVFIECDFIVKDDG